MYSKNNVFRTIHEILYKSKLLFYRYYGKCQV